MSLVNLLHWTVKKQQHLNLPHLQADQRDLKSIVPQCLRTLDAAFTNLVLTFCSQLQV